MIKTILTCLGLFFALNTSFAQVKEKYTVSVYYFTHDPDAAPYSYAQSINASVENGFVKTKRFKVVERQKLGDIKEVELKSKDIGSATEQMFSNARSLGVDYIILGHVENASATSYYQQGIGTRYSGYASFYLKIVNVSTTEIEATESIISGSKGGTGVAGLFDTGAMGRKSFGSANEAITGAIQETQKHIEKFVDNYFPNYIPILSLDQSDAKGNASLVTIEAGKGQGVEKGETYDVKIFTNVSLSDGRTTKKEEIIAKIKVIEVLGQDLSKCKVISGGERLAFLLNSGRKDLKVVRTIK